MTTVHWWSACLGDVLWGLHDEALSAGERKGASRFRVSAARERWLLGIAALARARADGGNDCRIERIGVS